MGLFGFNLVSVESKKKPGLAQQAENTPAVSISDNGFKALLNNINAQASTALKDGKGSVQTANSLSGVLAEADSQLAAFKAQLAKHVGWSPEKSRTLWNVAEKWVTRLRGADKLAANDKNNVKEISNRLTCKILLPLPKRPEKKLSEEIMQPDPVLKFSTEPVEKAMADGPGASKRQPSGRQIESIIRDVAQRQGIDPHLVKAVVKTESNFNSEAVSRSGAMGLMQLMPGTAQDLGVKDPFDPVENVTGGVRYLKFMLKRYGGNLNRALAAYNWGPGNVERRGLESMPTETRNYIRIVNQHYRQFKSQDSMKA
jgi:hypothetical protein